MATAKTVTSFLAALPAERRREIAAVRAVIRRNLPAGYQEAVSHGMIVYQVPLRVYPDTDNGQPLWYAAIGSQGRSCSLHLLNVYATPSSRACWTTASGQPASAWTAARLACGSGPPATWRSR